MNKKYLFGMLLSGAMLAACTADDLNTAPVAQEVNPSAPVFTVRFEGQDLQNRSEFDRNGDRNVSFDPWDLLSLYHGADANLTKWQNAVYKGEEGEDNSFTFKTAAIVNPGLAVLVYPAETGFDYGTAEGTQNEGAAAPNIKIAIEQTDTTKDMTPYMSEILDIKSYNDPSKDNTARAGYDKKYDIVLKKVGSNLLLNLNLVNSPEDVLTELKVPAIKVTSVEFVAGAGENITTGLFTHKVAIKKDAKKPAAYVAYQSDEKPGAHTSWVAASELDLSTGVKGTDKLSTADVTNNGNKATAMFTLLPFSVEKNTAESFAAVKVIVNTNYGKVELQAIETEDDVVLSGWKNPYYKTTRKDLEDEGKYIDQEWLSVKEGLWQIRQYLWRGAQDGTFYDKITENHANTENVGAYFSRTLNINIDNLDMDGLHVTSKEELKAAIAVYKALDIDEQVTFYLDGDKNGKFAMDKDAWEAVIEEYEAENITCVPCTTHGKTNVGCNAIQLENSGTEIEVPELKLGGSAPGVSVELVGNFKYTSFVDTETVKKKIFNGVKELVVKENSVLRLENNIVAKDMDKIVVESKGNVNVAADKSATVLLTLENSGIITINEKAELKAGQAGTIENEATTKDKATGLTEEGAGLIDNNGVLGVVDESTGKVLNYGIIRNLKEKAKTLITENGDDIKLQGTTGKFNKESHRVGTVKVYEGERTENPSSMEVSIDGVQGFIKLTVSKETPTDKDFGKVANYIIVDGEYTTITYAYDTEKKVATGLPSRVKYIEVKTKKTVEFAGEFKYRADGITNSLYGLIVPKDCTVEIPAEAQVNMAGDGVADMYIKGNVYYAGTSFNYTNASLDGYFGGAASDKNNITHRGSSSN